MHSIEASSTLVTVSTVLHSSLTEFVYTVSGGYLL